MPLIEDSFIFESYTRTTQTDTPDRRSRAYIRQIISESTFMVHSQIYDKFITECMNHADAYLKQLELINLEVLEEAVRKSPVSSKEYDALYQQLLAEADPKKRQALLTKFIKVNAPKFQVSPSPTTSGVSNTTQPQAAQAAAQTVAAIQQSAAATPAPTNPQAAAQQIATLTSQLPPAIAQKNAGVLQQLKDLVNKYPTASTVVVGVLTAALKIGLAGTGWGLPASAAVGFLLNTAVNKLKGQSTVEALAKGGLQTAGAEVAASAATSAADAAHSFQTHRAAQQYIQNFGK